MLNLEALQRSHETMRMRSVLQRLINNARKQPRTEENFEKLLAELDEICLKSLRGEVFEIPSDQSRGATPQDSSEHKP